MKLIILLASLGFGFTANATLYGYRCKGTLEDSYDVVRIRGGFDDYSNTHVGRLEILGDDSQPADSSFPGGGTAADPRWFPEEKVKVVFKPEIGYLSLEGKTDNKSKIFATIVKGQPSNFIAIDLKSNSNYGPYKHTFRKSAQCWFRTNALFPGNDWNF